MPRGPARRTPGSKPGPKPARRGARRRTRRRRIIVGGAAVLMVGGAYASYKVSKQEVQHIEQHTGKPPEELTEQELEAAMDELDIQDQELTSEDEAAIEAERSERQMTTNRPNILLIICDDLGYSDVGVYGSEIPTPNLDMLALEGVQFTAHHAVPQCSPSRAALMTGVDYHRTGMGAMGETIAPEQKGKPGYEGYLNSDVVTIAEVLKDVGYHTYMAGKWHLGAREPKAWPDARGFKESFALLTGGASHWTDNLPLIPGHPGVYVQNGQQIKELPPDYYSTKDATDFIMDAVRKDHGDGAPFFAYLAYQAPHDPLHAPKKYIEKHRGRYDDGWDALHASRLEKMKRLGILAEDVVPHPRPKWMKAWDELNEEQKEERARDMEVYAAMIDYLDESLGRLFRFLKQISAYENTLIIFTSDHGASRTTMDDYAGLVGDPNFFNSFDNSLENRGLPGSAIDIGPGWAYAATVPFRLTKGYVTQGGIVVPLIVKLPESESAPAGNAGAKNRTWTRVLDLMPTVLEFAGADYPVDRSGREILPPQGESLMPLLSCDGDADQDKEMGWELYGMPAYRAGDWKALRLPEPYGSGEWQLYNLADDPGELNDLADEYPAKLLQLVDAWEHYAVENGVIVPDKAAAYARPPRSESW